MMSKDEERKALAKIEKIIEEAGGYNDSYIGFAFDGCADDARRNIEEDAAYSWRDRASSATKQLQAALDKVETLHKRAESLDTLRVEQNRRACEAEKRADDLQAEINRKQEAIHQLTDKTLEQQNRLEQQAAEIIKLKARIYDLINKEN